MLSVIPFFALLQKKVPDELRGRVLAVDETLEHAVPPPSCPPTGWMLDLRGSRCALVVVGASLLGARGLGMLRKEIREVR
jgi:hypothetical protein